MKSILDGLYREYNKREYVSPDPLEYLYKFEGRDVEIVGLIASSLAYGRVASILASIGRVLDALDGSPAEALASCSLGDLERRLDGFAHRFVKGPEMARFLVGIGETVKHHGSLEGAFVSGLPSDGEVGRADVLRAMDSFARTVLGYGGLDQSHLIPRASLGSACKRLALYIRWMARRDDVDPGCWPGVPPSSIIIPLDTHMFRITTGLGFTRRRAADGRTALEVTDAFAAFCPDDPVRYDFALTRFGIRSGMSDEELLAMFGV